MATGYEDYDSAFPEFPPTPVKLTREKSMYPRLEAMPFMMLPPMACPDHPPPDGAELKGDDDDEPTDEQTPDCACGKRAGRHKIKKEDSVHRGKWFFSCAKKRGDPTSCPFWELMGGPKWKKMDMAPTHVTCDCRKQARAGVQKRSGKSFGRVYYSCARRDCSFFRWAPNRVGL